MDIIKSKSRFFFQPPLQQKQVQPPLQQQPLQQQPPPNPPNCQKLEIISLFTNEVIPTSPCCNFCTILDLLRITPGIWPEQVLNPSFRTFSKAESSPSTREPRCRGRCDRISFLMNWFQQRLGPRHSRCPHVLMFTLTRASLRLRNRSLLWEPPSNFSLRMRSDGRST